MITELNSKLTAIGFTEYEARVYIALLGEHPATGYQLSKKSGIPRSMVYEALGRLHVRGAVLKTEERRATLYRPLPPDALLDRFAEEHSALIQSLRSGLREEFNVKEGDRLWSISGRSSVIPYAKRLIQGAKDEIDLVLDDEDLNPLQPEIVNSIKRGPQINILLTGKDTLNSDVTTGDDSSAGKTFPPNLELARHPPKESELHELTGMLMVVSDGETCLIARKDPGTDKMNGTITNNPNLVMIARQFVWMELFTQRINTRIGAELLSKLDAGDRQILESLKSINS